MKFLTFDIGGSSVKQALVDVRDHSATIVDRYDTMSLNSNNFDELRDRLLASVSDLSRSNGDVSRAAISTTGAVDASGLVISAGHFNGYKNVDWNRIFVSEVPAIAGVYTVNDGKASTWAEYTVQGQNGTVFVHFVVGTGVGGGIVCFDRLLYGDDDSAGGVGHQKICNGGNRRCSCRRLDCVETVSNSSAVVSNYVESGGQISGGASDSFRMVLDRAKAGDAFAMEAFEKAGGWLGVGISNIMNVLNPRAITVGGGVVSASGEIDGTEGGPYLRSAIEKANALAFEGTGDVTTISAAKFGNDGGLLGAALLAAREV